jgi:DNA-binding response OmpR family regulator
MLEKIPEPMEPSEVYPFTRQRVLIVEDDEEHAVLLRAVLPSSGLDVSTFVVGSLREARTHLLAEDRFGGHGERSMPSLILLDLGLPDGNGFEMLEWLKNAFPDIPVLVLTSSDRPEDRQRSLALGAKAFRTKPGDFREVVGVIEGLLNEWRHRVGA